MTGAKQLARAFEVDESAACDTYLNQETITFFVVGLKCFGNVLVAFVRRVPFLPPV